MRQLPKELTKFRNEFLVLISTSEFISAYIPTLEVFKDNQ